MRSSFCFFAIVLLTAQFALAEVKNLKLLNPDGTVAEEAQVVAIVTPGVTLDENLKELPSPVSVLSKPGTTPVRHVDGTIVFDVKPIALVAQNDFGFAFVLLSDKTKIVQLRPWANLKIDTSKVPEAQLKSKRLSVIWTNCFAGNAVRPLNESNDPFGSATNPFDTSEPVVDWRFDRIVIWRRNIEDAKSITKVPPGEVTIALSAGGLEKLNATTPMPRTLLGPVRTISKKLASFEFPNFGSVTGRVSQQLDLPDWNQSLDEVRYLRATPVHDTPTPKEVNDAFLHKDLNALASFYGSEKGTQYRCEDLPEVTTTVNAEDGFIFDSIPEGTYYLELAAMSGKSQQMKYKVDADDKPLQFTVTAGKTTSLAEVDKLTRTNFQELPQSSKGWIITNANESPNIKEQRDNNPFDVPLNSANTDPFAASDQTPPPQGSKAVIDAAVKKAELKLEKALIKTVEQIDFQGTPLSQVMQQLQDTGNIPIRINTTYLAAAGVESEAPVSISLPSMTLRSALLNILSSVSEDLTFAIRNEVLLITTKKDVAKNEDYSLTSNAPTESRSESASQPQLDTGKTFVEQWLKSSQNESDPQALSKALKIHLEQEFDSNQKSRQAELERLRMLLKQSEDFVNTRQTRRAEIIGKRLEELLEQSKLAPASR